MEQGGLHVESRLRHGVREPATAPTAADGGGLRRDVDDEGGWSRDEQWPEGLAQTEAPQGVDLVDPTHLWEV